MSVFPKHKTGDIVGLLFLGSSALLILSLWSHASLDPSLNVASPGTSYANYAGRVGALISDVLLQLVGLAAFLLPILLVVFGFIKVTGRTIEYPIIQVLSVFFAILAACAGLFLALPESFLNLSYAPGGVVGIVLGRFLSGYLNQAGALVVVATVLALALILTTRLSFESTISWVSARHWNPFAGLAMRYREWKKRRVDHRELKRLDQQETRLESQPLRKLVFDSDNNLHEDVAEVPSDWPVVRETTEVESASSSAIKFRNPGDSVPYQLPPLDFLQASSEEIVFDESELIRCAEKITSKYSEFGVHGRVLQIHPGPVVTTFEFKPDPGVKYSRVTTLSDDLCLALKAESIRIDRIPGKNTVGIEVPNSHRHTIFIREVLGSRAFEESESPITLGVGKLINGNTFVTDLARMPHLLIAGSTGSGKSVAINSMVCSILYKASPQDVRFIMVDPKRLELGLYADIPHLLTPIVTDPKQAANALNWAVREMENRYKLLAQQGVRNLEQYNRVVSRLEPSDTEEERPEHLPMIVVVVDELADLMMTSGKEVEASLTRLAQMARAIGIHLILATQRPSVDVITGLIKANFPSRISFRVSSKVDSRTILDANGAEQLLGQGDMLFLSPRTARPVRLHGGFVTESEIAKITQFLKDQDQPDYRGEILEGEEENDGSLVDVSDLDDPLWEEAARFVVETRKASTSLLQRRFRVGYGRAARLLDMMEHEGLIGPPDGSRAREILAPPGYFDELGDM